MPRAGAKQATLGFVVARSPKCHQLSVGRPAPLPALHQRLGDDVVEESVRTTRDRPAGAGKPRGRARLDTRLEDRGAPRAGRQDQDQADLGGSVRVPRRGSWTRIIVFDQPTPLDPHGYPAGWVPTTQLSASTSFGQLLSGQVVVVTRQPPGYGHAQPLDLSFGTRLPVASVSDGDVVTTTPAGSAAHLPSSAVGIYPSATAIPLPSGQAIVNTARAFLGLRYF